jgi:hypothetical protein
LPVENPVDVPGWVASFEDLNEDSVGEVHAAMSAATDPIEKRREAGFTLCTIRRFRPGSTSHERKT